MSESPYAIPAEELPGPVPAADQVEILAEPHRRWADPGGDPLPYADGGGSDADGD